MNNSSRIISLSEIKIQAQILLKKINSSDHKLKADALAKIAGYLKSINLELAAEDIQLKHCLGYFAADYGFANWANYKFYFEHSQLSKFIPQGGFFNQWFSNYREAKAILKASGGYLLPYQQQFFICERGYIEYLGLNPDDENWRKITYNWVEPENLGAWQELNQAYANLRK